MAHNLATNQRTGAAAMLSVREKPWHGLGVILPENVTVAQAIEIAGLDYQVDKTPTLIDVGNGPVVVPDSFVTYRMDTLKPLGVVGSRYEPIQNTSAFEFLTQIADVQGEAVVETAGALGNGERAWVSLKLPDDITIGGEKIEGLFNCMTSHDGSSGIVVYVTPVRVVCQNTLNLSLAKVKNGARAYKIKHTQNWEQRMDEAKRVMGFTRRYFEKFEEQANLLLSQEFSRYQYEQLCQELLPKPGVDASKREKGMFEARFTAIMSCWDAPDLGNITGTKWAAINAIADYSDHSRAVRTAGDEDKKFETLFLRSFEDTSLKDRAMELLTV